MSELTKLLLAKPNIYTGNTELYRYEPEANKILKKEVINFLASSILALGRMDMFATLALSLDRTWPKEAARCVAKALPIFGFGTCIKG